MASLANTASKMPVNVASRSRIKNLKGRHAIIEVHQQIPCLLSHPGTGGVGGDAKGRWMRRVACSTTNKTDNR